MHQSTCVYCTYICFCHLCSICTKQNKIQPTLRTQTQTSKRCSLAASQNAQMPHFPTLCRHSACVWCRHSKPPSAVQTELEPGAVQCKAYTILDWYLVPSIARPALDEPAKTGTKAAKVAFSFTFMSPEVGGRQDAKLRTCVRKVSKRANSVSRSSSLRVGDSTISVSYRALPFGANCSLGGLGFTSCSGLYLKGSPLPCRPEAAATFLLEVLL